MKIRLTLVAFVALCALFFAGNREGRAEEDARYHMASESYYRLDVDAGIIAARVEAELKAVEETTEVRFWLMSGARNISVRQGDTALAIRHEEQPDGQPSLLFATLAEPLRRNLTTKLTVHYEVAPQQSELVTVERGHIEALFVSQGAGSFVFLDLPERGDNFVEPGCLRAHDQPGDVRDAGLQRWVCGYMTLIALNTEDPSVQDRCAQLDDRCRQRLSPGPFAGFAQSITDEAKRGVLEAEVPLQGGPVMLTLKYIRSDRAWAEQQFDVAQRALPLLEGVFGFPYPHNVAELRQSHFIGHLGFAGLAFDTKGEMLITNSGDLGFDSEVTVHELAHQWAGPETLSASWLWEGLAEYATRRVAPALGISPLPWQWEQFGYSDPLATWWNGSTVTDGEYWYGKSNAFWAAFEGAIGGPEAMTTVLRELDDEPGRRDGSWFMDAGERVSGQHLDELFLSWVWNRATSEPLLAERRVAHNLVASLTARAQALGLSGLPTDIATNLAAWQFRNIAAQVDTANRALDEYEAVLRLAQEAGLPASDGVNRAWGAETIAVVRQRIDDQRQAIEAITSASFDLADEPEGAAALSQLARAREEYGLGNFGEAKQLAAGARTTAYNEVASERMLAIAKQQQSTFEPSFLARVGLYFADPEGDLARAEEAYQAGDHAAALKLSRSAYDAWNEAEQRGLMRLALLAGAMCLLSIGTWYLLQRLDPHRETGRPFGTGHVIEQRRQAWKDWDNSEP